MATIISNCGHDENNKYSGGTAGDQTGTEWYLRSLYSGFTAIFRHPDANVRALIAQLATEAAKNDLIGYDQNQRLTFWSQLQAAGYYPSKITVACEADCSSGVAGIVKAVGYILGMSALKNVSASMYTGNQSAVLTGAGFTRLTFSTSNLVVGDIIWKSGHTAIVVDGATGTASASTSSSTKASSRYPCKGWTGSQVRAIQSALVAKGYSVGSAGIDGDFGTDTDAAVRRFQSDNSLDVDGIVGPKTSAKLLGSSSAAYTTGTYVTTVDNLNIRSGPGTNYSRLGRTQITANARLNSNSLGQLNKGTTVTVKQVQQVGNDWWGKIPSGWICLYNSSGSGAYVRKV